MVFSFFLTPQNILASNHVSDQIVRAISSVSQVVQESTIFSDDFENYAVGTFPSSGGWELVFNGRGTSYQMVSDTYHVSGTRSFRLWGSPNWSAVAQKKFSSSSRYLGYEGQILIGSVGGGGPGRAEYFGFYNEAAATWGKWYAIVAFNEDSMSILAEGGTVLETWTTDVWYKIKVILDRDSKTYNVWINEQQKGFGLSITNDDPSIINALGLQSDHPGVEVYYDDVRVFEASEPYPLSLSVWTDKGQYGRNEIVTATMRVMTGQTPVQDASVTIQTVFPNGTSWFVWTDTTDGEGYATFQFLLTKAYPEGEYVIHASAYKPSVGNFSSSTQFKVMNAPPEIRSVTITPQVLTQPAVVKMQANATDLEDGTNIKASCIITISNGTAHRLEMTFDGAFFSLDYPISQTDPKGTYEVLTIAEDTQGATAQPFHSSFENAIAVPHGAANVKISDTNQNPILNAALILRRTDSFLFYKGSTDENGMYLFQQVLEGHYFLDVSADEFAPNSTEVEVAANQVTGLNLSLLSLPIIEGYVETETGNPISNAEVEVSNSQGLAGSAVSNQSGMYRVLVSREGTFVVTASANGFGSNSSELSVSLGMTIRASFTLEEKGRLEGQIKDAWSGQGINNATVHVGKQYYLGSRNFTDEFGNFSFSDLLPEDFVLRATAAGYLSNSTSVRVNSGETTSVELYLTPTGNITGVVRALDTSAPIEGASIVLADSTGTIFARQFTDANGTYTIASVTPASYILRANAGGYNCTTIQVTIIPYNTVRADFFLPMSNMFLELLIPSVIYSRGEIVQFQLGVRDNANQSMADRIVTTGLFLFGPNNETLQVEANRTGEIFVGNHTIPSDTALGIWSVLTNVTDSQGNIAEDVGFFLIAEAFYLQFQTDKGTYISAENVTFSLTVARFSNLAHLLDEEEATANVTICDENNYTLAELPLKASNKTFSASYSLIGFKTGNYTSYVVVDDHKGNAMREETIFDIAPDFSITVSTDKPAYNRTELVRVSGYASYEEGSPVKSARVLVKLEVKGFVRSFSTITTDSGYFEYFFKPAGYDAGNYKCEITVLANRIERKADMTFQILGLVLRCEEPTVRMALNSTADVLINIGNIGETPLTGLDVSTIPADESVNATILLIPSLYLEPGNWSSLVLHITTNGDKPKRTYLDLLVQTAEGAIERCPLTVYMYPPLPAPLILPQVVDVSLNPGSYFMTQINITNIGYGQMANVHLAEPELSWISTDAKDLGDIGPQESKLFDIIINTPVNITLGVYQDEIRILSSNYIPVSVYIVVTITSSEKGGLLFHVKDNLRNFLAEASVEVQYQEYYTDTFSTKTNTTGYAFFEEMMIGRYVYIISKDGYESASDAITVFPGAPTELEVLLSINILDVSFQVEPIKIQDQYLITLNFTFQTEIPPPTLLPIPPAVQYFADRAVVYENGYSETQRFTILNTGLISLSDVILNVEKSPNATGYELSFLDLGGTMTIDSIDAKGIAQIPLTVTIQPGLMITNLTGGYVGRVTIQSTFIYFDEGSDIPRTATTEAEVRVYVFDAGLRRLRIDPPVIFGFNINGVFVVECGAWPDRLDDVTITNCAPAENVTLHTIAIGGGITLSLGWEFDAVKMITLALLGGPMAAAKEVKDLLYPIDYSFFFTFGRIIKTGEFPGEVVEVPLPPELDWLFTVRIGGGPLYSLLFQTFAQYVSGKINMTIPLAPSESAVLQSELWSLPEKSDFTSGAKFFAAMLSNLMSVKLKFGLDVSAGAILFFYKWDYTEHWEAGIVPIVLIDVYAPKISISFPVQPGIIGGDGDGGGGGIWDWIPHISFPKAPIIRRVIPRIVRGVHETVKLSISQQATLERDAFLATLSVGNRLANTPITGVSVELEITYQNSTEAESNFFVAPANLKDVDAINGTGTISPASTAIVRWTLIPKPGAGGTDESGLTYLVQALISYTVNGTQFNLNSTEELIVVKPQPMLALDYYVPSEVKANVPFKIAVKVTNVGHGTAHNFKIDSAQPVIYENIAELLVKFSITGSAVRGQPAGNSLKIDFGDIPPGTSTIAYWVMTCSLSGEFINFTASFTHANELGGADTSLIQQPINTYILMRDIMKDDVTFLFLIDANNDGTPDELVDPIFASGTPVVDVAYTVQYSGETMILLTQKYQDKWIYIDVNDPYGNKIPIMQVVRSDGKILDQANYWMANGEVYIVDDPEESYTVLFSAPALSFTTSGLPDGLNVTLTIKGIQHNGTTPYIYSELFDHGATVSFDTVSPIPHDIGEAYFLAEWKDENNNSVASPIVVVSRRTLVAQYQLGSVGSLTVTVPDKARMPMENVSIYIDGNYVGLTNSFSKLVVNNVLVGSHTIEATREGYNDVSRVVRIYKGKNTFLALTMSIKTYTISVFTRDAGGRRLSGASVFIDGKHGGTTDSTGKLVITKVQWGNHTLMVRKSGYFDYTIRITVTSDLTLNVILVKTYTLTLFVKDSTGKSVVLARVYLDNVLRGRTDHNGRQLVTGIAQGNHTLMVRKSGYFDYTIRITVTSDLTLNVILVKTSHVTKPSEEPSKETLNSISYQNNGLLLLVAMAYLTIIRKNRVKQGSRKPVSVTDSRCF
jgi:hypothetical protein